MLDGAETRQRHSLPRMNHMPRQHQDRPAPLGSTTAAGIGVLAALTLLMQLAGCASPGPNPGALAEPDVPGAWAAATVSPDGSGSSASTAASPAWWQSFNDPVLSRLAAQAQQANTSVLAAQAALQQARALRNGAAAGLLPQVGSSASAQHGTRGSSSTGNQFQVGLDASWELDFFGGRRSAVATSDATARASAASLADVQVSIAAEVGLNYIALRSGQARLAVAQDNLAAQQHTRQLTEWRAQAGAGLLQRGTGLRHPAACRGHGGL